MNIPDSLKWIVPEGTNAAFVYGIFPLFLCYVVSIDSQVFRFCKAQMYMQVHELNNNNNNEHHSWEAVGRST
jgi:hypothetical protein